jgi:hypothetical protein
VTPRTPHATSAATSTTSADSPTNASTDGSSDGGPDGLDPLPLTENCRASLARLELYECGLVASESATRSIVKRVCYNELALSNHLIQQVRQLVADMVILCAAHLYYYSVGYL